MLFSRGFTENPRFSLVEPALDIFPHFFWTEITKSIILLLIVSDLTDTFGIKKRLEQWSLSIPSL